MITIPFFLLFTKILLSLWLHFNFPRMHFIHQSAYLQPTVLRQWKMEPVKMTDEAEEAGGITWGGDMRADSPG